ncbi:hypothetical protein ACSYDW_16375 [Paeniglutamicibacter sp. R2-26]|uniref:hypothetical protein n=1 Tax=Paeniglutamicibacter sp. R2-26 TaxID=3144417 RepID=UPI003EE7094A
MTPQKTPSPPWLEEFRLELMAGLKSQLFTDPVEIFVVSRAPRIIALVVESNGFPPEGTIRDIDNAIAASSNATVETVALDIAVCDIAEPGPPGIRLDAPELREITTRWPGIGWRGDVDLFGD